MAFDATASVRKGLSRNKDAAGVFDDSVNIPNVRGLVREYCFQLDDDDDDVSNIWSTFERRVFWVRL